MTLPAEENVASPYYTFGILHLSDNFHRWEASQGAAYRAYRQAWVRRSLEMDPGDFPLNLNMEVTTRCNLACTFCSQPSLTKEQLGDMPWELFTRVIDEGKRYRTPAVNLNGLGEPTLLKDLPRRIAYAKQSGFVDVMFHTNGTIMTKALAASLIEAGLDRIIFSVDSPDRETYEAMRIRSKWDRVVSHVRCFAQVRQELGRATPIIRTTMVVTDKTVHQVGDFLKLWKPVADQITVGDLTWRTKALKDGEWTNQERSAIPVDMDQVKKEAIRRKIPFACPYLYQSTFAFWNGDVIPCSNPNARKQMVLGNLDQSPLHEVWLGKAYQDVRRLHAAGRWYEHPVCGSCEVPLIELYKTMEKQAKQAPSFAASELASSDGSTEDLALRFQKNPRVSVLIAAYNQAGTLPRAIDSLLNQDLETSAFELIIVDDGSTDETAKVLQSYGDRIRVYHQAHQGLVAACNLGLAQAKGEYFARLDSDDFADPAWLRRGLETLEARPEACCLYPDYVQVNPDGSRSEKPAQDGNLYSLMACGSIFRTEAVRAVGGYRPLYWEEYDLYLRLRSQGAFVHLQQPLYYFQKHASSMTAKSKDRKKGWKELAQTWGIQALQKEGSCAELDEAVESANGVCP